MRKLVPSVPVSNQLPDPSWYWYAVMAAPPFEAGANTTLNDDGPAVTVVIVGADGATSGMPGATAAATPAPTASTARRSTLYVVPLPTPVVPSPAMEMSSGLAVEGASSLARHVV